MLSVTKGLVLREVGYKESDKILTVLTADGGKQTVRARGCRRKGSPLAAGAQLLVYSELTLFSYKDRYTLNAAEPLELFWGVRQDVDKLALGSYFAEVVETVCEENIPAQPVLSHILNALYALAQLPRPAALIKAAFELKLMSLIGYEPMLEGCLVCGTPEPQDARFLLLEGQLRCGKCRAGGEGRSMPISPAVLAAMRHVVYGNPKHLYSFALEEGALKQFSRVCEGFLLTQLDRGFHTLDFYRQLETLTHPGT